MFHERLSVMFHDIWIKRFHLNDWNSLLKKEAKTFKWKSFRADCKFRYIKVSFV